MFALGFEKTASRLRPKHVKKLIERAKKLEKSIISNMKPDGSALTTRAINVAKSKGISSLLSQLKRYVKHGTHPGGPPKGYVTQSHLKQRTEQTKARIKKYEQILKHSKKGRT